MQFNPIIVSIVVIVIFHCKVLTDSSAGVSLDTWIPEHLKLKVLIGWIPEVLSEELFSSPSSELHQHLHHDRHHQSKIMIIKIIN